jgi:hypothetical protein
MTDDLTEPNPLVLVEGVQNPYEEPFLWRVEMYLMSKYAPEFVEATIFKVRAAALERAKIVKEHHFVINDMAALQREIENDLNQHVRFQPQSFQPKSRERNFGQRTL